MDERTLKREGVCAASLPTTMVRINFGLASSDMIICAFRKRFAFLKNAFPMETDRK